MQLDESDDIRAEPPALADGERRCLAAGEPRPRARMVRFVVGPDQTLYPDLAEKLPGRGLWVSAERAAIEQAAQRNLFAKAARCQVKIPADLADRVEQGLRQRLKDMIGLARRGGHAVAGYEKAADMLRHGQAGLVLRASDGSAGTAGDLPLRGVAVLAPLTAEEMGAPFDRPSAVNVAIAKGAMAERIGREAARVLGLRRQVN